MVAQTPLAEALMEQGRTRNWLAIQVSAVLGRPVYPQQVSLWTLGKTTPVADAREAVAEVLGLVPERLWSSHAATGSRTDNPADGGVGGAKEAA